MSIIKSEINTDENKIVNIMIKEILAEMDRSIIASLDTSTTCDTGSYIYYSTENATTDYEPFKWWASGPQSSPPPQEESIWEGIW